MFSTRLVAAATLVVGLAVPAAAFAQTPAAPAPPAGAKAHAHHHRGGPMRAALGKLNLSAAQKSQLDSLFAQARQQRLANRNADPATRRAAAKQFRSKVDGILSPAQRSQFHVALRQARAQHRHMHAMHQPAPGTTPS
ncbi:MAG TPA: hypothetical protein VHT05_07300 [Candidatus Elarobacter sp.]|nr:hypothetical protein [Candidatus Elarobacter sp.]